MCNCVNEIEKQLKPYNTGLKLRIVLKSNRDNVRPEIGTYKLDSGKRGQPAVVMASFCPFCGQQYAPLQEGA